MSGFRMVLEARDPGRNVWRRYELAAGPDLFGDWVVEVTYGRIGTPGRLLRSAYAGEEAARACVRGCLRRRHSAPTRIGVAYRVTHCDDPNAWLADGSFW